MNGLKSRYSLRGDNGIAEGIDQFRSILTGRPIEDVSPAGCVNLSTSFSVISCDHAVPLAGSWTGFPSDFPGMNVEVSVTADGDNDRPEEAPRRFTSRA